MLVLSVQGMVVPARSSAHLRAVAEHAPNVSCCKVCNRVLSCVAMREVNVTQSPCNLARGAGWDAVVTARWMHLVVVELPAPS